MNYGIIVKTPQFTREKIPLSEIKNDEKAKVSGIYFLYDEKDRLMYIGKSKNIKDRITQHINSKQLENIKHNFTLYSFFNCDDEVYLDMYETYLINDMKPLLNRSKVYTYRSQFYNPKFYKETKEERERKIKAEETLRDFKLF